LLASISFYNTILKDGWSASGPFEKIVIVVVTASFAINLIGNILYWIYLGALTINEKPLP